MSHDLKRTGWIVYKIEPFLWHLANSSYFNSNYPVIEMSLFLPLFYYTIILFVAFFKIAHCVECLKKHKYDSENDYIIIHWNLIMWLI